MDRAIPLAFGLLAASCAPYTLDPASLTFAGERFALVRRHDDGECTEQLCNWAISKDARTIVALGPGVPIAYDADQDGRDDLLVYAPPDGANSAGWLDIYLNGQEPLASVEPATAKRKGGGWARVARADYPGLFDEGFLAMIVEGSWWF